MTPNRRLARERLGGLLATLIGALVIAMWHPGERGGFWQGIEGQLLDARFALRGPLPPPASVAIVTFDDTAMAQLNTFPPPRSAIADAVSAIWDAGARSIALDFLLVEPKAGDIALAAALKRGASVLGVAEADVAAVPPQLFAPGGFAMVAGPPPLDPLPALLPAAVLQETANLGHVTVKHGGDGALRRMSPALALKTADGMTVLPGLSIAALIARQDATQARLLVPASGVGGELGLGSIAVPLDFKGTIPLNFYGPRGTIPTHSAASIEQADLQGKTVFIGATAVGFGDRQTTPFDPALPGVEAHATLAANLLNGPLLRRDTPVWMGSALVAGLAAIAGFGAAGIARPLVAAAATLAIAICVAAILQAGFLAGWWLDATTVFAALALGASIGAGLRRLDQRRRTVNLARYQPANLVEALATDANPLVNQAPQHAVAMFVDVARFTTFAEHLGPRRTEAFLSMFHQLVEDAAHPCGGMIAHFAGDGALVIFGLPRSGPDDAEHALAFIERLYTAVDNNPNWPGLGIRVGGHTGLVQLGVLGGAAHRQLSVSGDVVNTASRLQEVARAHKASLALSGLLIDSSAATLNWAKDAGLSQHTAQALRGRDGTETIWIGEPPGGTRLHANS
ncbi:CHASE2 domain-containing protein [Meridianimarinicoccus aquatilis]|uniref:Adenylate/guanylate cyclase domain-containing protein n=1 Tax=Meridianimarinicoccus aquatilis TaxID=2552766 RepID=A0A4V3BB12_9RHOB|nr:adenylate/guanylate cyclase domain-containing protein [Fluviibacterium aquatile]TDL85129.1 adenylate/guanylate cyclase domain-containing protein [Fluviibacterium aquatile]